MRPYILILVLALLSSCGGSKGDSLPPSNSSGFPDVSGRYNLVYKAATLTCAGQSDTMKETSSNMVIDQDANVLYFRSEGSNETPGMHLLEATESKGYIQKNGSFTMTFVAVIQYDAVGIVDYSELMSGNFHSTGCTGSSSVTLFYRSYGIACTAKPAVECTRI